MGFAIDSVSTFVIRVKLKTNITAWRWSIHAERGSLCFIMGTAVRNPAIAGVLESVLSVVSEDTHVVLIVMDTRYFLGYSYCFGRGTGFLSGTGL